MPFSRVCTASPITTPSEGTKEKTKKVYFLDQEQLDQILALAAKLKGGSDTERDAGHSLWRMGTSVRDHQEFDPAKPVTGASGT